MSDLRHAFRSLLKSPGFFSVAVLTLALGIGANTAIFSVVNAVLLRPLPYPEPEQLTVQWQRMEGRLDGMSISWPNFQDWSARQRSFTSISLYRRERFNLSGFDLPENIVGALCSSSHFATAGIAPLLGRTFTPEEDRPGAAPVVVIGHSFWQRKFSGNPAVLGRTLTLNGVAHTIIGVMPPAMGMPRFAELWVPIAPYSTNPHWQSRGNNPGLYSIGRLKPGVTIEQARADLDAIGAQLEREHPATNTRVRPVVTPLMENTVGHYRAGLGTLMAAVGAVLLIACANVASLLLARAAAREREIAVRAALGASRSRIVRQLLTESMVLAVLGGGAGVLVAWWSLGAIQALAPADVPRFQQVELDGPVLAFSLGASLVTGFIFGLWPAWRASRPDLRTALQSGGRGITGSGNLRQWLVAGQVALTLVLLTTASLLVQSLSAMQRVALGFDAENVLVCEISLPDQNYRDEDGAKLRQFWRALLPELRALPGVRAVGAGTNPPLRSGWQSSFRVEGQPEPKAGEWPHAEMNSVAGDYFSALEIPLVRGRPFDATDQTGPRSIIIDQVFAEKHFPGIDPLGQRVRFNFSDREEENFFTIVGIASTVRLYGYDEEPRRPQAYLNNDQLPRPAQTLLVKTDGDPRALIDSVRKTVATLDPALPVFNPTTYAELVERTFVNTRLYSTLLTLFSALALLLAGLGLYGIVAYAVVQRQREIGIRLALGAVPRQVVRLVLRQGLTPLVGGLTVGLLVAATAGQLLEGMVFSVNPHDPVLLAAVALILAAIATLACWLPARRAARIEPVEALRDE